MSDTDSVGCSGHKQGVTMIYDRWNHSQAPPKKPPHLPYTLYNKARHKILTSSPNKRSLRDETQKNRINRARLTSPKLRPSKTIHDWHRPLRIVSYRAIIYASFRKRTPMTVTWSNFVNNTLIASRQAYRRSRYCLQNWTTCIFHKDCTIWGCSIQLYVQRAICL